MLIMQLDWYEALLTAAVPPHVLWLQVHSSLEINQSETLPPAFSSTFLKGQGSIQRNNNSVEGTKQDSMNGDDVNSVNYNGERGVERTTTRDLTVGIRANVILDSSSSSSEDVIDILPLQSEFCLCMMMALSPCRVTHTNADADILMI
jgi:hypothetical protein